MHLYNVDLCVNVNCTMKLNVLPSIIILFNNISIEIRMRNIQHIEPL